MSAALEGYNNEADRREHQRDRGSSQHPRRSQQATRRQPLSLEPGLCKPHLKTVDRTPRNIEPADLVKQRPDAPQLLVGRLVNAGARRGLRVGHTPEASRRGGPGGWGNTRPRKDRGVGAPQVRQVQEFGTVDD